MAFALASLNQHAVGDDTVGKGQRGRHSPDQEATPLKCGRITIQSTVVDSYDTIDKGQDAPALGGRIAAQGTVC